MTNSISHSFLTLASDILADSNFGVSGSQLLKHFNSKSVEHNIEIPHSRSPITAPNKRTAFLENLERFPAAIQFQIIDELSVSDRLKDVDEVKQLRKKLFANYGNLVRQSTTMDSVAIEQTEHYLSDFPKSEKLFKDALSKRQKGLYERNLLDDLRLCLELLLKDVLRNNKSLENQLSDLGAFQKAKGMSSEVTNMFVKLLEYYSKYQNSYVKHNDAVNSAEVDFIINLSSAFMSFLVSGHK